MTDTNTESLQTRNIGPTIRICQLNVESISRAKCECISKLLLDGEVDVVAVQETHAENEESLTRRGRISGYTLLGATYGIATYVCNNIDNAHLTSSDSNNNIHTVIVRVEDIAIVNVYKPPATEWPDRPLPVQQHPAIYIGDFNSHHQRWKYPVCDDNGTKLADWADDNAIFLTFDAKDKNTFKSAAWNTESNPDLCFVSCNRNGTPLSASRTVSGGFPHSQHRPVFLEVGIQIPLIRSIPRPRWNLGKADWCKYSQKLDGLLKWITPTSNNYKRFVGAVMSAAKKSISRGFPREYIPGWDEQCELLYNDFQETSNPDTGTVSEVDFQRSSRRAWGLLRKLGSSKPATRTT